MRTCSYTYMYTGNGLLESDSLLKKVSSHRYRTIIAADCILYCV